MADILYTDQMSTIIFYQNDNVNNKYPYLKSDRLYPDTYIEPAYIGYMPPQFYQNANVNNKYPYLKADRLYPDDEIKNLNVFNNNIQLLMAAFSPKKLTIIYDGVYPDDIVWPDDTLYPID